LSAPRVAYGGSHALFRMTVTDGLRKTGDIGLPVAVPFVDPIEGA
jgi:hypothetical protein